MTRNKLRSWRFVLGLALAGSAACGSNSASLTGPSSTGGSGGTRITGRVTGIAGVAATTANSLSSQATTAVRITIAGTGISTTVDGGGNFTLTEVPPGTVQLTFSGPNLNASLTLSGVRDGDEIRIEVRVEGSNVKIEFETRHHDNDGGSEVEGPITSIDPAARTLRVAGLLINVPQTARIHRDSRILLFSDLSVGQEVEVHGTREGTTIRATEIEVEDDDD